MNPRPSFSSLILLLLCVAGCGENKGTSDAQRSLSDGTSPARAGYSIRAVNDGGKIVGKVIAAGRKPDVVPLEVTGGQVACNPAAADVPLQMGPQGEVQGVVVYIESIPSGKDWPTLSPEQRTIDQEGCRYRPRWSAVPVGAALLFKNSDPVAHNVRVESGYDIVLNVAQANANTVDTLPTDKPGPLSVACDYHPWMFASVVVVPNPYYAVTGSDGSFSIDEVPPGTYRLVAWYPDPQARPILDEGGRLVRYGYGKPYVLSQDVVVSKGATASIPFTIVWR